METIRLHTHTHRVSELLDMSGVFRQSEQEQLSLLPCSAFGFARKSTKTRISPTKMKSAQIVSNKTELPHRGFLEHKVIVH